jgi:uncharacterized protein YndB with AHSA1/START domain
LAGIKKIIMHQVSLEKEFPVPAEQLYAAWTSPEELKQWWHPMGNHLKEVTNELNEGGTVRYVFEANGQEDAVEISGKYETVEPNRKLVYSWNWHLPHQPVGNGEYKLHIGFVPSGEGSKLTVLQENFGTADAVQPHQEGWEQALSDLEAYLSK